ncbi:acyl-CoA desaturase [Natronoglycomyces albus]|uniref:Acyl-CoA desaturase n=2 Tax=Natronoglycomyces albus TaxID=2811108 RepID=A0A895XTT6_9ACTN|nr:acyl-CoA desaturase [Natronoglycomyces albus]
MGEKRSVGHQSLVYIFLIGPMIALAAAVPFAWTTGLLGVTDIVLALVFFFVTGHGVTLAYHRMLTHGSFKANRPLKIFITILGSMAVQGNPIGWVADHRRHHAFSDKEGDPHSPWLFGTSPWAITKGFWHSHMGWMFQRNNTTNVQRYCPDLLRDKDLVRVSSLFWLWTILTFLLPAVLGGLITMSWMGALTAFFWAGLVRVSVLHHTTWATNSICHMVGERPFKARDKAANVWPLAIASFGESWHNLHHADPTSARHGVLKGQIDTTARLIWIFEKFGWATDVKWPSEERIKKLTIERDEARAAA